MTTINFTANRVTSQKLAAEKLARLQELKQFEKFTKPAQKNNIEMLKKDDPALNVFKDFKNCLKNFCAKDAEQEKTAMRDLLSSLEEQIALEPQNIELRKAYETIKSNL